MEVGLVQPEFAFANSHGKDICNYNTKQFEDAVVLLWKPEVSHDFSDTGFLYFTNTFTAWAV